MSIDFQSPSASTSSGTYLVQGRAFDGSSVFDFEWHGSTKPPFYDPLDNQYWEKLEAWPHEEINLWIVASIDPSELEE